LRITVIAEAAAHDPEISFISNVTQVTDHELLYAFRSSGGCHPRAEERLAT